MRRMMRWCAGIAGSLVLAGSLPAAVSGAGQPLPAEPPDLTLRQIHMIETRDGSKLWELWADRAEVHEGERFTILERVQRPVEVVLYSRQGVLRCVADRATIDLTTKDVRMEGGIVARSEDGAELRTTVLRWEAATRRILTDQPVIMRRGGWQSRGRGLEAEADLAQVRIFQNITSHLRTPRAAAIPPASQPSGARTPRRSSTP